MYINAPRRRRFLEVCSAVDRRKRTDGYEKTTRHTLRRTTRAQGGLGSFQRIILRRVVPNEISETGGETAGAYKIMRQSRTHMFAGVWVGVCGCVGGCACVCARV